MSHGFSPVKSEIIKKYAEENGIPIVDIPLVPVEQEDLHGIPLPKPVLILEQGKFTPVTDKKKEGVCMVEINLDKSLPRKGI